MCLFPIPNTNYDGIAFKRGVKEFECGACPECLHKRASKWVLKAVYEAKLHTDNCMVTLTYDNFIRNKKGNIIGETPVDPNLKVNQRDIQLFIKRLRKWYMSKYNKKLKYIACAEYGSHTHRAHYHCILFGVKFPDIHYYKKSKRGNVIYMSNILTKLWGHGICTVDSIRVHSAIARYCTKYCAKSRSLDTFTLCSQNIGYIALMRDFNGKSYFIDGREYPIPRYIWENYIMNKYSDLTDIISPKYVNIDKNDLFNDRYYKSFIMRFNYRTIRDNDEIYKQYISYWKHKSAQFDSIKLPVRNRIMLLDNKKYLHYKTVCLLTMDKQKETGILYQPPFSNCGIKRYLKSIEELNRSIGIKVYLSSYNDYYNYFHLPLDSRPNTASDTESPYESKYPSLIEDLFIKSNIKCKNILTLK